MEPVCMNMSSCPHQNGQVYYRPSCYPGTEARPPMTYESWPWGGNYGYAPPGACHACCNHAYMPAHCAWGSPYSHVPPHHFPGHYPYSPVHYMPPPPYTVMNQPRYEYEKSVPMENHNHPLHHKEQKNVRIEEEEPERETRKNGSLVPSQFKNPPYPIVWLPPDYNEGGKVKSTEGRKDTSRDVKEHENRKTGEQWPTSWNGWLPFDLKNAKETGDGRETSRPDDGKRNFQFPFFWIPYKPYDTERDNQKLKDGDAKPSLEPEKGPGGENFQVNGGNIGDHSASKVKDIPVKEVEQHVEKESSINMEKEGDTSVKIRTDNGEKRIDEVEKVSPMEGSKRKSPSPPKIKSSKLPPVCLRVDPLPRKKSANAKSRSPSPPGDNQKLEVKSNEAVKVHSSEQVKESSDKKTIAVVDGNTSLEKSTNVNVETPGKPPAKSEDDVSTKQAEEKPEEETTRNHSETYAVIKEQSEDIVSTGGEREESFKDEGADAGKKCSIRELSEEEAAVIIQSAYRSFVVRRWKPMEKLRQIARVREAIAEVKRLIQEMELSSDIQSRSKQKNIVSETIMSLLLKLDTIQGLHPSIREVRKSVVKELVSLQEQLDTITCEKPENSQSPGQESVMRHDQEDLSRKSEDVMSSENSNKINPVERGSDPEKAVFPETNPVDETANVLTGVEAAESCVDEGNKSEQGPPKKDEDAKSANLIDEAASVETWVAAAESSVDEGVKSAQGLATKDEEEKSNEVLENNETSVTKEDCDPVVLGQGCELSSLLDDSSARATDVVQTEDHETFQSGLVELPQRVVGDLCSAQGTNHSADSSKPDQSPQLEEALHSAYSGKPDQSLQLEEALAGSPAVEESHGEIVNEENNQTVETQEVSDLPLDGYELETEMSGFSKPDYKSGTEEEADVDKIGDAASEPNECTFQHPVAHMLEPSEAPDEREVPSNEESHENLGIRDSTTKEMTGQLVQEGNIEERGLINKDASDEREFLSNEESHENSGIGDSAMKEMVQEEGNMEERGLASMGRVESAAAAKSSDGTADVEQSSADASHSRGVSEMGVLSNEGEECNPLAKDAAEDEENKAVGDESSRKLMEEKERLREMVAKLIETGQEQLTAISSLSGRVKELEKKLSRKKKLKVKKFRAPSPRSSFDTVGVAV